MDGGEAGELGEAASLCRVGADLGGPVGADEHDGDVEEVAGEVLEEVPGVGVGPVEVLDPDRDDPVGAEVADELEDRCEEAAGAALVAGWPLAGVEPAGERRRGRSASVRRSGLVRRIWRSRSASGASGMTSPPMGTQRPT